MLSVLTFRPEFVAPWPMRSHMTPISLNLLERSEVEALVGHLAGGKLLPGEVLEHIVAKSDGVPLFVEELTKTIIESGTLTEEGDRYRLEGALADLQIPSTLQDSLMARLDRTPTLRQVAQMGAVLGREFAYEMLKAVVALEERVLQSGLEQLVGDELLYKRGRGKRSRYIFKHALIQDAAYQSLLKRTRQQYHRQVAELLEARFPELVATQPELLGHHYTGAGLPERAIEAWERAAHRALEGSANKEAIAYFYQALSVIEELPPSPERQRRELRLQTAIAGPLMAIKGYGDEETGRAFTRAQELSAEVGASEEFFPVLYGRWAYDFVWMRHDEAKQTARRFTELANQQAASGPILMAHRIAGLAQFTYGQPDEARRNLHRVVELYDAEEHASLRLKFGQDPCATALAFLALCLWELGYPEQADSVLNRSIAHTKDLDHVNTLAYVELLGASTLHYLRGDHAALAQVVASVKALAQAHHLSMWSIWSSIIDAYLMARRQRDGAGVARMQEGLDTLGKQFRTLRPYMLCMLGDAHAACGDSEAALDVLDEAIELGDDSGELWFAAEAHRLRAESMLAAGRSTSEVEACLFRGPDIARAQQAKSFELRSATSLARLWAGAGHRRAGVELLAPIYGWFTEGAGTVDLENARSLLTELDENGVLDADAL